MEYSVGTHVFGDWEIVGELGEGSYGKVYELKKTSFGICAKAALKVIRVPRSVSEIKEAISEGMDEKSVTTYFEGIVEQFVHEIAIMSELKSHPNIVSCEDYMVVPHGGKIGWDILIRMELLTSLSDYQATHAMDEACVRRLACDICNALVFCGKKGLIHRDIKPGNIFVDSEGRFKLGDFGVARTAEKTVSAMSKQGTENYMAPEVYFGRPYGATADIYSLGIMLYRFMNANRLPFYPLPPSPIRLSDRENALIRRMKGESLLPPASASEDFSDIILKACAHEPSERYLSAAEFLTALGVKAEADTAEKTECDYPCTDDATEVTYSPFAAAEEKADYSDEKTESPFGFSQEYEETNQDFTYSPFGEKSQEVPPVKEDFSVAADEDDEDEFNAVGFWQKNLSAVWAPEKKDARWKAYFAPQIPLQICSNAIFNIAKNSITKSDIVAVLDCTDDVSAPCSAGIIITRDKVFLQLGVGLISGVRMPEANVGIVEIKKLKSYNTVEKRLLFGKYKILNWSENDGKEHSYTSHSSYKVRYEVLMDLILKLNQIKKEYMED